MTDCASLEADEAQRRFVSILKEYPIMLNVSMLPEIRKKRTATLTEITKRVELEMNVPITECQIAKKIQNLKSRIKKRNELMKAGKKTFYLKDWQKDFSDFMEEESKLAALRGNNFWVEQGAVSAELLRNDSEGGEFLTLNAENSEVDVNSYSDEDEMFKPLPQEILMNHSAGESTSHTEKRHRLPETEETKRLSTAELKRLVLLEQLNFYRDANKLVQFKLDEQCKKRNIRVVPSAKRRVEPFSLKSFTATLKRRGPSTEPCGTPCEILLMQKKAPFIETTCLRLAR
ncbi:uncharacterized protein LOC128995573 [Macrosteles quadrilineatus]|uniref:uncharacterized protein LOC128995573 n=1 Tax=Macrosteles quadrilineatus TaxID=74068 RepID=UPI0023E15EFE|nr:uncharacterized protein LOC128995573 [Macrosteles quadrilineatus]